MKSWLQDDDIEMYSTHNEGKSVIAEISIKTFKNKIYKYMTSVSKNIYIDKLDDKVNKYNTYHSSIKMKLVNVQSKIHIDFGRENNHKDHQCKVGDHVRSSKYKNIFAKGYTSNQSEEIFVIKNVKILCC